MSAAVGLAVGLAVGPAVDLAVGLAVERAVGTAVAPAVGSAVEPVVDGFYHWFSICFLVGPNRTDVAISTAEASTESTNPTDSEGKINLNSTLIDYL